MLDMSIRKDDDDNFLHNFARINDHESIKSSISAKEDYLKACMESNEEGNFPAMVAAKHNNREALFALLTSMMSGENYEALYSFLHHRNNDGQNIMALVAHHSGSLFVSLGILIELEKKIHDGSSVLVKECLRRHVGSSFAGYTTVRMLETLKIEDDTDVKSAFVGSLITAFFLKILFYGLDVFTDVLLALDYYEGWSLDDERARKRLSTPIVFPGQDPCVDHYFLHNGTSLALQCYPKFLSNKAMFLTTVFIITLPAALFFCEQLHYRIFSGWLESKYPDKSFLKLFLKFIVNGLLWIFWPLITFFRHFWYLFKYLSDHGTRRISTYGPMLKEARLIGSRTQLIEVCTEASLQPLVQFYLIFVTFISWGESLREELSEVGKDNKSIGMTVDAILSLTKKQILSILMSIFTLSWSFTHHYRAKKANAIGALGSAIYFLYTFCFVVARILSFEMFAYHLGPGNFGWAILGLAFHILIFAILHFIFSDTLLKLKFIVRSKTRRQFRKVLLVLYNCLFNGFANIYVHNYIEAFVENLNKPSRHKEEGRASFPSFSTLLRQSLFDIIFLTENIAMVLSARQTLRSTPIFFDIYDITSYVILGFWGTGFILKLSFYSCCHIWSDLVIRRKSSGAMILGKTISIL